MMDAHDHMQEQLSAYLDGELSPDEENIVRAALDNDPALRKELDELRATRDALAGLPELRAPDGFAERVLKQASDLRLTQPSTNPSPTETPSAEVAAHRKRALHWLEAAAVLLVVLGVGITALHLTDDSTSEQVAIQRPAPQAPSLEDATVPAPRTPAEPILAKGGGQSDEALTSRGDSSGKTAPNGFSGERLKSNLALNQVEARKLGIPSRRRRLEHTVSQAGQSEVIYTHNLATGQQQVESVLLREGVSLAAGESPIHTNQMPELNQAWNFAATDDTPTAPPQDLYQQQAQDKRQSQSQPPRFETQQDSISPETVTYVVYGDPETLQNIQRELDRQVRRQQVVSQAAEPVYQQVLAGLGNRLETNTSERTLKPKSEFATADASLPSEKTKSVSRESVAQASTETVRADESLARKEQRDEERLVSAKPASPAPQPSRMAVQQKNDNADGTNLPTEGLAEMDTDEPAPQEQVVQGPQCMESSKVAAMSQQIEESELAPEHVLVIRLKLRQPMRFDAAPATPSGPASAPSSNQTPPD